MVATVNGEGPRIGPIAEVVIATSELEADRLVCERLLGWTMVAEQEVTADDAARWRSPAAIGVRSITVGPAPDAPGAGVRLVESAIPTDVVPLRTHGWAAMEVIVADVDAVAAEVDALGIEVLGRPTAVGGTSPGGALGPMGPERSMRGLRAMQVALPGGTPVYLTEIGTPPSGFELPRIVAGIGGVFIVVVATPDLDTTRAFLERTFSLRRVTDHPLTVGVLNRSFRLPPTTRHRVSSLQLAGAAVIEIDQYPPQARARSVPINGLPPGIAAVELYGVGGAPPGSGPIEGPFDLRLAVRCPQR